MTLFPEEDYRRAAPQGPLVRVRLTVAYDGRGFHGFAFQPGIPTVAGTLMEALELVLRHQVDLTVAGRTDAGVHGWAQVVSFDARAEGLDLEKLQRAVNKLCKPQIVVRAAEVAPDGFDARRWATGRRYRYTVLNRPVPDPFLSGTAWWVDDPVPLDVPAMRLACDPLIGEHDFTTFCKVPRGVDRFTMVRRVESAAWSDLGDGVLRFEIAASSFCQQMVRSIVGLLVDVGRGKRRAGEVAGVLRAQDRSTLGTIAPAHGLCLWEVTYGDGPKPDPYADRAYSPQTAPPYSQSTA